MKQFPQQLMNPHFRFFLLPKNLKIPMEKKWNSVNNYPFFHTKVIEHLKANGNVGIVTGIAGLIVLDFDDYEFYKSVRKSLPYTYTTTSASKRAPHYYYYLKGEMIRKIGIDNAKGERALDIQANRCGIICPPSSVNRRYYETHNNLPIADIDLELITAVFKVDTRKPSHTQKNFKTLDDKALNRVVAILERNGIARTKERHFKCPFHGSSGNQNLFLFADGGLFCFHCQTRWGDIDKLLDELLKWQERGYR